MTDNYYNRPSRCWHPTATI